MPKNILKALPELVKAGVISNKIALDIQTYYGKKPSKSQNRLLIVFGVLGAILVGLGIILIVAHNWDEFSKSTRTTIAFLPLLIGQVLCGYVIIKQSDNVSWRESVSVFLFFTVGASISLVSQIYHIPGNLSSFLLTWMLVCLPVIYLMKSSITSLLVLIGITYYACESSYWTFPGHQSFGYWIVMVLIFPQYVLLIRKRPTSNFSLLHNWIIPLSLIICLGVLSESAEEIMYVAYFSLFGIFYLIGNSSHFMGQPIRNNSYLALGSSGTVILLLMLSFDWFWEDLIKLEINPFTATEFYISLIITLMAISLFIQQKKIQSWNSINRLEITFILFILIFIIGLSSSLIPVIMINLLAFSLGILTILKGVKQNHLGILNYGLLIITALVICRFFDTNISFVVRGLLFVGVGVGFFMTNYWLLKKRRAHEK